MVLFKHVDGVQHQATPICFPLRLHLLVMQRHVRSLKNMQVQWRNLNHEIDLALVQTNVFVCALISHLFIADLDFTWKLKNNFTIASSQPFFRGGTLKWLSGFMPPCSCAYILLKDTKHTGWPEPLHPIRQQSLDVWGFSHVYVVSGLRCPPLLLLLFGGHRWLITRPGEPPGCYTEPLQR